MNTMAWPFLLLCVCSKGLDWVDKWLTFSLIYVAQQTKTLTYGVIGRTWVFQRKENFEFPHVTGSDKKIFFLGPQRYCEELRTMQTETKDPAVLKGRKALLIKGLAWVGDWLTIYQ